MNVQLHIERLILDGLPIEAAQGPVVQAAVEAELARLLAEQRPGAELQRTRALAYTRGGDLRLPDGPSSPEGLGGSIARAVEEGLRQ